MTRNERRQMAKGQQRAMREELRRQLKQWRFGPNPLPRRTLALVGLLVASSNADGVAKVSLREIQVAIATGSRHPVVHGIRRLEALGWIAVERGKSEGAAADAVDVYTLVHPLLRDSAGKGTPGWDLDDPLAKLAARYRERVA